MVKTPSQYSFIDTVTCRGHSVPEQHSVCCAKSDKKEGSAKSNAFPVQFVPGRPIFAIDFAPAV
eukprot:242128-Rhodomonas_salina.2